MNYVKKEIGAYNLHIIKTNLYKTITVKIFFREKAEKENITKRNFLSRIMMLGSNDYKTKVELTKAEQDLYAANISGTNRRIGNYLDTGISLKVLHDKYTEEGNFEKSLDLLDSLIFNPKVTNKAFDEIDFNTVYEEYKADLNSLVENNMIKKIQLETDRYDKNTDHCHLCCIKCNKIIDIGLLNIDSMIMDNYNFKVLNSDVVLKGICSECMERKD